SAARHRHTIAKTGCRRRRSQHRSHGRSYLERSNRTSQRLAPGYWQDEVMPAHAVIIGGGSPVYMAAASSGRIATALRNTIMRATPAGVALRGLDSVIGWTPPDSTSDPKEC